MVANSTPQSVSQPPPNKSAMQNWLDSACVRVGASHALLVVQQGSLVKPMASVPAMERLDPSMLQVARTALKDKKVVTEQDHSSADLETSKRSVCVGLSMRMAGRPGAVVLRLLVNTTEDDAAVLQKVAALTLRRADDQSDHSGVAAKVQPEIGRQTNSKTAAQASPSQTLTDEQTAISQLVSEQGCLLGSVASLVNHSDLDQSLHALVCRLAQQFRAQRVYIGCVEGRRIAIRAVSGLVDFDVRSALLVDVVQAMKETQMMASTIRMHKADVDSVSPQNHASLAEQLNNPALISIPLVTESSVVGVLLLERDLPFDANETAQLERLSLLISPMLALKATDAMTAWQWLRRFIGRGLHSIFGTSRLGLKLSLLALVLLAAVSSTYTQMHRVDASASLEPSTQRAVVSGLSSFLGQVEARAGDIVHSGDVLAQLDVDELELDRIKWQGEKEKLNKEYRANLAQRDRSKVRVLEAQRSQAQAKIDLIDAQIERATLRAPIDGVVVSGDHFQSLGRPVERGELLFEVASMDDFRLILQLDEKDIGWVSIGSKGQLRLRSLTDRTFPFEVTGVTPVSEPGEGANTFRIEANLEKLPESLRPGMQGVAKVDVEPRAIGWIWTRHFVEWARMQIWKFGGV